MKKVICLGLKTVAVTCTLIVLFGCYVYSESDVNAHARKKTNLSAWITSWDFDMGEKELKKIEDKVEKVSFFGAYFNAQDQLFIPAEFAEKISAMKTENDHYETYLTFVNDKENEDGSVIFKDIDVLKRIFSTEESMEQHVDDIIALALQGGYDGIEMDYERVWRDEALEKNFLRFFSKLYEKALQHHMKVRLVLEPGVIFSEDKFIEGPEYVVMLYNLYGVHSGPGPKADRKFIEKTIDKMAVLPDKKAVAFSTGGCKWGSNGEKKFLTEAEAVALAEKYRVKPKRDKDSQCMVFSYQDQDVQYDVWYADYKTLNYWVSIAKDKGIYQSSIWRLGGNIAVHKIK